MSTQGRTAPQERYLQAVLFLVGLAGLAAVSVLYSRQLAQLQAEEDAEIRQLEALYQLEA